jgi:hemoglobin
MIFSTFPPNTFLENLAIDEHGNCYVTSLLEGIIYRLDPHGQKETYVRFEGKPAGILYLGNNEFLVNGWDAAGIPTIFLLTEKKLTPLHQPKEAQFLNGMAALDTNTILICDSLTGCILQYHRRQNTSECWLRHDLLAKAKPEAETHPATEMPAANGIKIFQNAVYVSNTDKRLFIRIPLQDKKATEPEVILENINIDDFAFDEEGNCYAATHIHNSVIRISPQKQITTIAGETSGLAGSTAVAFGTTEKDNYCIYVTTNGGMFLPPEGGVQTARIVKLPVRIPTPCEWAGGVTIFEKLTNVFYVKVLRDPLLEPIFNKMSPDHAKHVAWFLAEILQGPKVYTGEYGPDALHHVIGKHLGKQLTEAQRKRWVDLLMESADEIALAADPEFRSTFAAHIEWGTRFAVLISQTTENPITPEDHIPQWGWGEVKGPFEVVGPLFRQKPDRPA